MAMLQRTLRAVLAWAARRIFSLRYRLDVRGLDEVRRRGTSRVVFLPSHSALVDPGAADGPDRSRLPAAGPGRRVPDLAADRRTAGAPVRRARPAQHGTAGPVGDGCDAARARRHDRRGARGREPALLSLGTAAAAVTARRSARRAAPRFSRRPSRRRASSWSGSPASGAAATASRSPAGCRASWPRRCAA